MAETRGLIIAAPGSGSGKTTVTLGLLRALRRLGVDVAGAKSGPDYIDPAFHGAASGRPCGNLDAYAMTPARILSLLPRSELVLIEGAVGLFDGAAGGRGSVADLARITGFPVVLVVDAARMGQSVAALVRGFALHDPDVALAAVILNNVGSDRHEALLREALAPLGLPVLGALRRTAGLALPSRHLGLVQAAEHPQLDSFIDAAAKAIAGAVDLDRLVGLARPAPHRSAPTPPPCPAGRIAIARDAAFLFTYEHLLNDWRAAGAELSFFSPLDDQPAPQAELIYLPGGYPELHAGRLAGARNFARSVHAAVARGATVWGECGGYMVLGDGLVDADGQRHAMLGLLRLETSFADRRLHLGYRELAGAMGPFPGHWAGHEFHYATTVKAEGAPLYQSRDGWGRDLGPIGLASGTVFGSFAHLIDRRSDSAQLPDPHP